jgi:hypothetical protein
MVKRKPMTVRRAKRQGMLFDVVSQLHGMRTLGKVILSEKEGPAFRLGLRATIRRFPRSRSTAIVQVWK